MNRLSRFSILGIIISLLIILLKPLFFSKIIATLSLIIFLFLFFNYKFKKSEK